MARKILRQAEINFMRLASEQDRVASVSSLEVDVYAEFGPLIVHETVGDFRLTEAKSAAFSVTLEATGASLVTGVRSFKAASEFAELAASVSDWAEPEVVEEMVENWLPQARSNLPLRKGFLYKIKD